MAPDVFETFTCSLKIIFGWLHEVSNVHWIRKAIIRVRMRQDRNSYFKTIFWYGLFFERPEKDSNMSIEYWCEIDQLNDVY